MRLAAFIVMAACRIRPDASRGVGPVKVRKNVNLALKIYSNQSEASGDARKSEQNSGNCPKETKQDDS